MGKPFGSRALVAVCALLVALLGTLAAVQYRWSTRVAAADAQREKEHLDSAASLFATRFNAIIGQAAAFLQNDARSALESGERLGTVPKLIADLYYLDIPAAGQKTAGRLSASGLFEPAAVPDWIAVSRCGALVIEQPPAWIAPIYHVATNESHRGEEIRIVRALSNHEERCFVARIDQDYLRNALFPQLIRESFGSSASRDYDFAVVSRNHPAYRIYGQAARADLRQPFFSIPPSRLTFANLPPPESLQPGQSALVVQRVESTIVTRGQAPMADLFGPGIWELDVTHKGLPLAAAFEQTRRRDLLLSMAVEVLLLTAIAFLVMAARRMQRLADQKMQFVAGVSHELRTPVATIAMLARNQADGLVAGAEKVKQYGELIHQQSRRLNEMVERTLQYAGIHSGLRKAARAGIDLRSLIEEAVESRREALARAGFQVEVAVSPDLPAVAGDADLLRTAFDNLMNNAEKYADGARWMRVSASYFPPEKEIRISVEDRGMGIDPADQAAIFEPFCRGRAAIAAQIPGSGLGLSLVRSAAEAHRGSVTLVSRPGSGSTFTLHLPV